MKFFGWREVQKAVEQGEVAMARLMQEDSYISVTGYVWVFGITENKMYYEVVIAPNLMRDLESPLHKFKLKFWGRPETGNMGVTEYDNLITTVSKITNEIDWNRRLEHNLRVHVIGKITGYDSSEKEVSIQVITDIDADKIRDKIENDGNSLDEMIKKEYERVLERERLRLDNFLKKYIIDTKIKENTPVTKYQNCGTPIFDTDGGVRKCRENMEIRQAENVYYYILDGDVGVALTTNGIYFTGFTQGLFGKRNKEFFSWNELSSELVHAGKDDWGPMFYHRGYSEISLRGTEKHCIGFRVKDKLDIDNLNILVKELLIGLAGYRRRDHDIQTVDAYDEF